MKLTYRLLFIVCITIISALYVFPWDKYGVDIPSWVKPYKLGLDLHGGVELDYKIDLSAVRSQSGTTVNESNVIDSLKGIIDKRVRSLGLEEPTIQTAQYGPTESHLIIQIPVRDYGNISLEEKRIRNAEDITRAKETIGKVVQLEFREEKKEITDADKKARQDIAEKALSESKVTPFATVGTKYRDQYENVAYLSTSGALMREAQFDGYESVSTFPYTSPVHYVTGEETLSVNDVGSGVTTRGPGGYAITYIESMIETDAPVSGSGESIKQKQYQYSLLYIDERPSSWIAAETTDGKVLNDKYLTRAGMAFTQAGAPQVELVFNDE